eukprot:TRINITY_DN3936_c1_g1_i1.p1 TRINITY_DN3936_c1_g1~~TRINITY_DN3936_c1_g1_i1.p1  ORF type:complete len:177 (+),score=34.97 TRINITY_DN3936_c1_g1_i1:847-1377(+)
MWERTVSIGSAGKTFGVTGYKIGWNVGPASIIGEMAKGNQNLIFCVSSLLQESIAISFEQAEVNGYWDKLKEIYSGKRQLLLDTLYQVNLKPVEPEGSYFVLASTESIDVNRYKKNDEDSLDYQFCRWLTTEIGVCAIPPSAFFQKNNKTGEKYARFTFCKQDEVLLKAREKLQAL